MRSVFWPLSAVGAGLAILAGPSAPAMTVTYTDLYTLAPSDTLQDAGPNSAGSTGQPGAAQGGQIIGSGTDSHGHSNALLWSGPGTPVELTPGGFASSNVSAVNGGFQVGSVTHTDSSPHAILWNNSSSGTLLNDLGFKASVAVGVNGGVEVGNVSDQSDAFHAALWNGSGPATILALPAGFTRASAEAVASGIEVGFGIDSNSNAQALLWHGTNTATPLQPFTGFTTSTAEGTDGIEAVGSGNDANGSHALLWDAGGNAIALEPAGFLSSFALGVDGGYQVGYGLASDFNDHALLWNGSAGSDVDLQNVLPANFVSSQAYSISGNTIYGLAFDGNGNADAVTWTIAVPEPTSLSLLALGTLTLRRRPR